MKNGLMALNVLLLVAVAVLFYLHFSSKKTSTGSVTKSDVRDSVNSSSGCSFRIGYFEMDSIENNFDMVKDVKSELNRKEDAINNELNKIDQSIRNKANEYQSKAPTMTPNQLDLARNDLAERQKEFEARKQQYDYEYKDMFNKKMQDVRTKIENYLKEYNKNREYSFIISYEPGLVYYKDTIYNITADVVKGLNEMYKKKN
jgi:outer membrane protein